MVPGATYHLFNHANGRENLFSEHKNYDFFLSRLALHVLPVAHVYTYCLMPNHFHLLLKIKGPGLLVEHFRQLQERQAQKILNNKTIVAPVLNITGYELVKKISQPFSNFFNSYTQSFNKMYERRGSLFMPNMKTEEVFDDASFCRVVHYIHANPVHHGFVKNINCWPHSSYRLFLSQGPTRLDRDHVLRIFGGINNFIKYHEEPADQNIKWVDI